ncbi:MAG TPA: hypothetical protein VFM18_06015 [Methanosarcina sp.]|nr:hypothetical protein [Methanosarcina sp.]
MSVTINQSIAGNDQTSVTQGYSITNWLSDLTGTINQRNQLETAINETTAKGATLFIDRPILVDVTSLFEIWIPNNCKIVFTGDGVLNAKWNTTPVFVALHSTFEITNLNINYIGPGLDASINYATSPGSDPATAFATRLKNKMIAFYGNTFTGVGSPVWYGPYSVMAGLILYGQTTAYLKGKTSFTVATGTTADKFIPWCITGKGQWNPGLTVTSNTGTVTPDSNITQPTLHADYLHIDGALMGVQGEFTTIDIAKTRSYRYSDLMAADGSLIGGVSSNFTPPHLFYINERVGKVNINDTIDYGIWVTNNVDPRARRSTASGNCCSLKMNAQSGGANNYKSYRPDSFMDALGDISGYGTTAYCVENFYAEYDSTICGSLFPGIRFPSNSLIGTKFKNGEIVDTAASSTIIPFGNSTDTGSANMVVENVSLVMQDFSGTNFPCVYFAGAGHSFDFKYRFKSHSQTQTFRGVIAYQGATNNTISNTRHRAQIIGWRNFASDVNGLRNRVMMDGGSGGTNPNNNIAEVIDVSNGHTAYQYNGIKKETWTQKIIQVATAGAAITSTIKIPANWYVTSVASGPKVALGVTGGLTGYTVGWSGTPAGLLTVTGTSTATRAASTTLVASTGADRAIVITPTGGTFDGTGTIEIVFTCEYATLGE